MDRVEGTLWQSHVRGSFHFGVLPRRVKATQSSVLDVVRDEEPGAGARIQLIRLDHMGMLI